MQDIYDVIILDIMMPIMNGYEVLAELRKKHIYTPVLILTAKDALEDKVRGFNIGADSKTIWKRRANCKNWSNDKKK